jgi:hypothetical protein
MSLQIGRVTLDEGPMRSFEESWSEEGRSVTLNGILFTGPTRNRDRMAALHDDLLGLPLSLVPVLFGVKSHRNGYYRVDGAKSSLIELASQNLIQLVWEVDLTRQGADNEVDLESRLAGPVNRLNNHSLVGERWHAPAGLSSAYWVGSSTPGQVTRTGGEGPIVVYRQLPADTDPRWHADVEDYRLGRARIVDFEERSGTGVDLPVGEWELNNSLVAFLIAADGSYELYSHDGTDFSAAKAFRLTVNGVSLGIPLAVTVLHNEYERVTIRALWNRAPSGRVYADITLRRGSRFVEILMRTNAAATLGVTRTTNEASSAGAGFIRATSNDADGHRYIIGSLRTFTSDLSAGAISQASSTRFDAIIGAEVGGISAASGDQGENLMAQYVGTPSEVVQAVRR